MCRFLVVANQVLSSLAMRFRLFWQNVFLIPLGGDKAIARKRFILDRCSTVIELTTPNKDIADITGYNFFLDAAI